VLWKEQNVTATTPIGDAVTLEQVLQLAQQLRPVDQARLVVRLAPKLEVLLKQVEGWDASNPRQRLHGLLSDLGAAPSAEDIDEVQSEMWATEITRFARP
jgi:hypothetical protein